MVCGVFAQTIDLESNNVEKSSFFKGEEITVGVTVPYN